MGMWGLEAWQNDGAADWYDATFELTGLSEHVEETLNLRVDDHIEEIRAAAHLLSVLGENYIWPSNSRARCIRLAASRLEEIVHDKHITHPELVDKIRTEIEALRSRISD